jgi:hypothetical protein
MARFDWAGMAAAPARLIEYQVIDLQSEHSKRTLIGGMPNPPPHDLEYPRRCAPLPVSAPKGIEAGADADLRLHLSLVNSWAGRHNRAVADFGMFTHPRRFNCGGLRREFTFIGAWYDT